MNIIICHQKWLYIIFLQSSAQVQFATRGHACAESKGWSWHSLVRGILPHNSPLTMAEELLRDNSELRPFVLSNVRLTGTRIGAGAYGSVEEVAIPGVICAAKKIHEIFLDRSEIPLSEIRKNLAQFVRECQLMSTLRHPNIVQFLGVCFFPGSRLPALVMERLLTTCSTRKSTRRLHPTCRNRSSRSP